MSLPKYTLRVYGIVINEKQELLLSDEFALGMKLTKFPGGGMEEGEGTLDTLHREFMEELGIKIEIEKHFYTTDFHQPALHRPEIQLISIYYFVSPLESIADKLSAKPFDKPDFKPGDITFRFEPIAKLQPQSLSLPVDKYVLEKLKESFTEE